MTSAAFRSCSRAFGPAGRSTRGTRDGFVEAIVGYVRNPELWKTESRNAADAAKSFTYEAYLSAVRNLLDLEAA